jgi:hypothetical protein
MNVASLLFGTALVLAAWWMLLRAMPPAFRGAHDVGPARRRTLRLTAAAALTASFACYVAVIGIEQGPVFWICALMLGAMGVALWASRGVSGGEKRAGRRLG